jgi:hypothetical protein
MNDFEITFNSQCRQVPNRRSKDAGEYDTAVNQVTGCVQRRTRRTSQFVFEGYIKHQYEGSDQIKKTLVDDEVVGQTFSERRIAYNDDA